MLLLTDDLLNGWVSPLVSIFSTYLMLKTYILSKILHLYAEAILVKLVIYATNSQVIDLLYYTP